MQWRTGAMSCMLTRSSQALPSTATIVSKVSCDGVRQRHLPSCVHYYPSSFSQKCIRGFPHVLQRKIWSASANMRPFVNIYGMANDKSTDPSMRWDMAVVAEVLHRNKRPKRRVFDLGPFLLLANNLRRFGVAGVLSYGLLNTLYYLVTFLFVWFYVAPSEGGLGFGTAAQRFLKVFAMVWAGSQVTKLFRAAGALALAPFVDRGLNWYTNRFNFKSRGKAFGFIVGACILLAVSVFLIITTLWA